MNSDSPIKMLGDEGDDYVDLAHQSLAHYPLSFRQWLQALSYALSDPREIALVGDLSAAKTSAQLAVLRDGYRPFQVVALGAPGAERAVVPLLQGRGLVDGQAAACVCRGFACQAPVTEWEALRTQLGRR